MHFKTVALMALAAVASADNLKFTRISPPSFGRLARRGADGGAYEPEETDCGDGDTCAEACGKTFEQCDSANGVNSCFDPSAGETCCKSVGQGASCQEGYFCTSDKEESAVCCAEGTSLEECAKLNGASELTSAAPAKSSSASASAPAAPTASIGGVYKESDAASAPVETSSASSTASSTATKSDDSPPEPTATDDSDDGPPESGASTVVPAAALLVVAAFACLF